ncbi:MAG: hypothetical protein NC406_03160 [Bacteroides sp.]|nr:hypothetical protein [Bacteroides sp.]MCM1095422.1 hypothetical protein [Terasakiella sp.]
METLSRFLIKGSAAVAATLLAAIILVLAINASLITGTAMLTLMAGLSAISLSALLLGKYIKTQAADTV